MSSNGRSRRGLESYRRKRAADRTPEPFGGGPRPRPLLFVVQQHAARRLHFDLRLEWQGVLLSWAVPRGPSLDPRERRLAVQVEDHPVEYADFEGIIPEGNYGAGAVIVWDRGRWSPLEDPAAGLESGKLLFELHGFKLRGGFTLVRSGGRGRGADARQWLLIKKRDAFAREDAELAEHSVLSGLTLEELRSGSTRAARVRERLARWGAPRRRVDARRLRPMLAQAREAPFSKPGWLFEVKYDGYRVLASRRSDAAELRTRTGTEIGGAFPEIAAALRSLPYVPLVLDGELVVMDETGRPRFELVQQRAQRRRARDAERSAIEHPATYFAFDLLAFEEYDVRPLPLIRRKELLRELMPPTGYLRYAPHFEARGEAVFEEIRRLGLEGMMAKRADAPYRAGRSSAWQKIRLRRSDDFVIVGFTDPGRGRSGLGALHLAAYVGGELRYVGRVGSGLREEDLTRLRAALEPLRRDTPPCSGAAPRGAGHHWVEPRWVCEVAYSELTAAGSLRQPVFLRLRPDKPPRECVLELVRDPPVPPAAKARAPVERRVRFTHLEKLFWPEDGITKGELIEYARRIAPFMLPYLRDRPLVLTRHPDGIHGKAFFQKDAPRWVPEWIRTETLWSEHGGREIRYFVCDDLDSLLYVVNLGSIALHVWSSRIASLQRPDWCILDLDPKEAPFRNVVRVARFLHDLCEEIELPSFVKTSGSTGLHVLIPLGGQLTHQQSRALAELLAHVTAQALPEIATRARALRARRGRVYIDALQNGHGRLLVAPFSPRALPGAPVSMPLRWSEVGPRLRIERFTLKNAPRRMARLKQDPLRPVLELRPDLAAALAALERRLGGARS